MIKLIRIDDRLVHGQVALVWTPALAVDCLLVANDKVATDDFLKMTLGFAKPASAKLLIKSIEDTISFLKAPESQNLKVLVLINCVQDACTLSEALPIHSINFGGLRTRESSRNISKAITLTVADIKIIQRMLDKGIELEIRQIPSDKKQMLQSLI